MCKTTYEALQQSLIIFFLQFKILIFFFFAFGNFRWLFVTDILKKGNKKLKNIIKTKGQS